MNFNDDLIMDEAIGNYKKDLDEKTRKNEDRFNNFIEFLYKNMNTGVHICSNSSYYNEDGCEPYSSRDFKRYLFSLYYTVVDYANENYIQSLDNLYAYNSYFALKYKDKFYTIEYVCGQGTFIKFSCLKDFDTSNDYIDYELMINNKKTSNYNLKMEKAIFN